MIKSSEISRLLEQRELRQLRNETNKEPKPHRIDLYASSCANEFYTFVRFHLVCLIICVSEDEVTDKRLAIPSTR